MKTTKTIMIKAWEVLADLKSAAWLEQELHPELDRHRRHQMADICEAGNEERVWRVLGVADAEVRTALQNILRPEHAIPLCNDLEQPDEWTFRLLYPLPGATVGLLREKIHEYLVAAAMAERTGVIIPESAGIWRERASGALAGISGVAATATPPYGKVRRPVWPY